jgi:hypothetical protein
LDQFALKRATKENTPQMRPSESTSIESLIVKMAGIKGKSGLVEQYLTKILINLSPNEAASTHVYHLLNRLVSEQNFVGLNEILIQIHKLKKDFNIEDSLNKSVCLYRTNIGDNLLHMMVRQGASGKIENPSSLLKAILCYDSIKTLLNHVNLAHETPLLLASKIFRSEDIYDVMIAAGADTQIPDKKGNLFR